MTGESLSVPGGDILVGVVTGAHGLKGELNVKSFTHAPESVGAYGPVVLANGKRLTVKAVRRVKNDMIVVKFDGVNDRNEAETLKGEKLYVARAALPEPEDDEYYHADLVGLSVEDEAGQKLGLVRGLHNFGAGDIMEIEDVKGDVSFVPFTNAVVPLVDIAGKRVVVRPPSEVE